MRLTDQTVRHLAAHLGAQDHAMAGSSAALTAVLACSLGEVCVRISGSYLKDEGDEGKAGVVAERIASIREQLLALADEDAAAIAAYSAVQAAGEEPTGQDRLCEMPVEMAHLAVDAGVALQDFRPLVRHVPDDLEIAIALLAAAAQAATMVLDSNLGIWPEAGLLAKYEPVLADLRREAARLHPVDRIR